MLSDPSDQTKVETDVKREDHTVYVDNVGTTTVKPDGPFGALVLGRGDPYEADGVKDLLGRSYRAPSFAWTAISTTGSLLYTMKFPELFLTFPFIRDRLKNYRYFRGRAKITMRMNVTKYQYGTLMVSYLPFYDPAGTYAFRHFNLIQASQNNGMLFSANVGSTLEFELPFVSPLSWWDTALVGTAGWVGMLGTVFIHVLNPLTSSSPDPPSNVEVSTFVQMLDAEVAGLLPEYLPAVPPAYRRSEKVKGQMMPGNAKEAINKIKEGVIVGINTASDTITPIVEDVVGVASTLVKLGGLIGLDKPGTVAVPQATYVDPDADLLYSEGIDLSRKLTFSPAAQTAKSPMVIGSDPNPSIYDVMRRPSLIKRFEFDSTAAVDSTLYSFIAAPGMVVPSTSGVKTILSVTPMGYYSSLFALYRGSIKVMIHFNTSSFTTTRVRISHIQADTFDATSLTDYSGDFTSKVVDVTGDTIVTFIVPYLDPKTFMRFNWCLPSMTPVDHLGVVAISLVNPVTTPDITAANKVYASIFISAGDDFEVAQYTGLRDPIANGYWTTLYTKTLPTEEVTGQTSLTAAFASPFEGLTKASLTRQNGMITQDRFYSVLDLGKRYTTCAIPFGVTTTTVLPSTSMTSVMLDYLVAPFMFVRGSIRYKWFSTATAQACSYAPSSPLITVPPTTVGPTQPHIINGVWTGTIIGKTVASVEVPFMQEYPFYEFANTHPNVLESPSFAFSLPNPDRYYKAFGDDFSVGFQCAVPLFYYTTAGPVKKASLVLERSSSSQL
jgi:hypothetical protein